MNTESSDHRNVIYLQGYDAKGDCVFLTHLKSSDPGNHLTKIERLSVLLESGKVSIRRNCGKW